MTENDRRLNQRSRLGVQTWRDRRGTVLRFVGDVDLDTEVRFHSALEQALEKRPNALVADLTSVTFFGSAGLRHLVAVAAAAGTGVMRVVPSSLARRAIEVTGLTEVLTMRSTVDEAFDTR